MATRIYLDNAATTPICDDVVEVMSQALKNVYGNPSSIHADGRNARTQIEIARKTVAKYLNCSIGEIFFTSGGTESNNTIIKCSVRDLGVERIISSPIEHHCVLHTLESLAKDKKIILQLVKLQDNGEIDYDHLEQLLAQSEIKTLVSLMHSNNEIGVVNDLQRIGNICKEASALFHSDTVQTIGYRKFDLTELHIDFLSGSAHKFHGPKGVGFMYKKGEQDIKPYMEGGAQERNMRAGTENIYGIIGLAKALESAANNLEERIAKIGAIKKYFIEQLASIKGVTFNGLESDEQIEKVLSVNFPKTEKSDMLLLHLDIAGISASGGSACSSGSDVGSHVINGLNNTPAGKTIRFSFSHKNSLEEIDIVMAKLKALYPQTLVKEIEITK